MEILFPTFQRNIVPMDAPTFDVETELQTQAIQMKDGTKKLVPVLKRVDHSELSQFHYLDFQILELQAAGKADNLKPVAPIKLQTLLAADQLEQHSSILIETMDKDIASEEVAKVAQQQESQSETQSQSESVSK